MESLVCNFYLRVAARKTVRADPSLRYTNMFRGRKAANKQQKHQADIAIDVISSTAFSFEEIFVCVCVYVFSIVLHVD